MHAFFQTMLSTQITLGTALPLLVMAALLVLVATKAASPTPTPVGKVAKVQPTVLARGDAWLEKIGIGPFWRTVFWVLALGFAFLFLMAIMAAFVLIAGTIKSDTPTTSLGLGALLVALLGAPFLIWRTVVAQNTLDTARKEAALKEEALFNDKINAAAKDLAARRQVTRVLGTGKEKRVLTEWEDDIVTRAAAIDLLEGLANERPDAAPRIARQLSIYVRELSCQYPAKEPPTHTLLKPLRHWADPGGNKLLDWAGELTPIRSDMEKAAQTLGRLQNIRGANLKPSDIDLRSTNLQGFDLRSLSFNNARFSLASLQGARLSMSQMRGADFSEAHIQGAIFFSTHLQGAIFRAANMQRAKLSAAQLGRANFFGAQLQGAFLSQSQSQGAIFRRAQLQGANLRRAQMQGTDLTGAQLHAADLTLTRLQGSIIDQVEMSDETRLTETYLQGASFKRLDEPTLLLLKEDLPYLFACGFATSRVRIKLPEGIQRPAHWPRTMLLVNDFHQAWRAWAATLTPPVTIAPDYRDKDPD